MSKKVLFGFSLAEALITLLIVCLITIASIPVLTKKKRNLPNNEHGSWMCTLNSNGEHVYWSKESNNGRQDDPDTWTKTGVNYCRFVPTARARNFFIKAIGGGGGGAAGEFTFENKYNGSGSFSVSQEGEYRVLVVGGGGGGGSKTDAKCDGSTGYGGGTGGFYEGVHKFYPGVNYTVTTGAGGKYDSDDKDDGRKNGAKGYNGASSSIISNSSGNLYLKIESTGGEGGRNYINDGGKCKISDNDAGGETGGSTIVQVGTAKETKRQTGITAYRGNGARTTRLTGNKSFIADRLNISFDNAPKKYPSYGSYGYGFGGYPGGWETRNFNKNTRATYEKCTGGSRCWGQQGGDGIVKIVEVAAYLGGSGESGNMENTFVPEFDKNQLPVKVQIGAGGKGGSRTSGDLNGKNGGRTFVNNGTVLAADSGRGGSIRAEKITSEKYSISGQNGAPSPLDFSENPFGGLAGTCTGGANSYKCEDASRPAVNKFGAGGGGGAAGYYSSSNTTSDESSGSDGAPGLVIINW